MFLNKYILFYVPKCVPNVIFVQNQNCKFMGMNFYLTNKNKEKTSIYGVVRYKSERYKRAVGESIQTEYWNNGWSRETKDYPHGKAINKKLKKLKQACETVCDNHIAEITVPDEQTFWKEVDLLLTGEVTKVLCFTEYFEQYKERIRPFRKKGTVKNYESILGVIKDFEEEKKRVLYFRDINMSFYDSLKSWMGENGYSENYFGAAIKKIKKVYKEARDTDKLHQFVETNNSNFKGTDNTADTVYLTEEELLRIYRLEFTPDLIKEYCINVAKKENRFKECGKHKFSDDNIRKKIQCLNIVRNKFLIGCCTALRVSDFNRLEQINLDDKFVRIRTEKTLKPVVIPIHWMLGEIINSGFQLSTKISDTKINKHIKEICELAGINNIVEVTRFEINKTVVTAVPKYSIITTHTARRTGATNMYIAGIPAISIMKITGHKSERNFLKYIKISEEENAELLAKHEFFTKRPEE